MSARSYTPWTKMPADEISLSLGNDRQGKTTIGMHVGAMCGEVAMVTPACVTNWPRCTGDGNFGTMWGPTDISKAKYSLDLTDGYINNATNEEFKEFALLMEKIDDRLLDFVYANQLRILGRKNLSRDEVKMLQIRTIRPKYDKLTGNLNGHSIQASTSKFAWDGMGGKYARKVNVCNHNGMVIPDGNVAPGDVVSATIYANQVYTGVGGDKFGIHWSFEDVAVVCQRAKLEEKTEVQAFCAMEYEMAKDYTAMPTVPAADIDMTQFPS